MLVAGSVCKRAILCRLAAALAVFTQNALPTGSCIQLEHQRSTHAGMCRFCRVNRFSFRSPLHEAFFTAPLNQLVQPKLVCPVIKTYTPRRGPAVNNVDGHCSISVRTLRLFNLGRFCSAPLPDWQEVLGGARQHRQLPVVAVMFGGQEWRLKVAPTPEGARRFQEQIELITGVPFDEQVH